jgi:hypothetical protein
VIRERLDSPVHAVPPDRSTEDHPENVEPSVHDAGAPETDIDPRMIAIAKAIGRHLARQALARAADLQEEEKDRG